MERTSQLCKEIWRLDEKIWKHFYPEDKEEVEPPQEHVVELWLHQDIVYILCDESIDPNSATKDIVAILERSIYAEAILKHCISIEEIIQEAEIRRDFHAALEKVKFGSGLSAKLKWNFSETDLRKLAELHKNNKCRKKIEELLTDCNYHYEAGQFATGKYEEFLKGENI